MLMFHIAGEVTGMISIQFHFSETCFVFLIGSHCVLFKAFPLVAVVCNLAPWSQLELQFQSFQCPLVILQTRAPMRLPRILLTIYDLVTFSNAKPNTAFTNDLTSGKHVLWDENLLCFLVVKCVLMTGGWRRGGKRKSFPRRVYDNMTCIYKILSHLIST